MALRIDELKDHKEILMLHINRLPEMLSGFFEEAKKIRDQKYSDFCKEHSDVLDLLDKYSIKDKDGISQESSYEVLQRLIKESRSNKKTKPLHKSKEDVRTG